MPIAAAAIAGGASLFGSLISGNAAADASRRQADALREDARNRMFSPVGTTNRFGTSTSQIDPATGKVISAGYQLSPELKAFQDRFMTQAGGGLTQIENAPGMYAPLTGAAKSMYDLGAQYLAQSPEEVAAKYMRQQQDLIDPSRQRSFAQLQQNMFNTGTGGLSVGATGMRPGGGMGLSSANPQMEAYYNAQAQQDRQLALDSERMGMERYKFGQGLFRTGTETLGDYYGGLTDAYKPFTAAMGGVTGLEKTGRLSFEDMIRLGEAGKGGPSNTAGITAQYQADAYSPFGALLSGAGGSPELSDALSRYLRGSGSTALDTSAYGSGLPGYQRAQTDIYGRP
jgi:hypothetical protein